MMRAAHIPYDIHGKLAVEARTAQVNGFRVMIGGDKTGRRDFYVFKLNPKLGCKSQNMGFVMEDPNGKYGDHEIKMMIFGYPTNRESDSV